MTENANSFVSTIVDTDWQKELASLKDELKDDLKAGHAAAGDAVADEGGDAAQGNASRSAAAAGSAAAGEQAFSFANLSRSLVTGTAEIFEQVLCPH